MRVAAWIAAGFCILALALAAGTPAHAAEQYTVAPHDTLYSIAHRFGVSVAALMRANGLTDPAQLRVGQVLMIPGAAGAGRSSNQRTAGTAAPSTPDGSAEPNYVDPRQSWGVLAQAAALREPRVPAPPGAPAAGLPAASPPGAGEGFSPARGPAAGIYVVQPHDTLYHIAVTHGLTVAELEAANPGVSAAALRIGQALVIPGAASPLGPGGPVSPPAAGGPSATPLPSPSVSGPTAPGFPGGAAGGKEPSARAVLLSRRVTAEALQYLGVSYVWGGTTRAGVDCSGLVYAIYSPYVPDLPRLSYDQWGAGAPVGRADLQPGDLVFFDTDGSGASHVGIYIGGGRFVHPSASAGRVVVDELDEPYYASHYLGARRVL